MKINISKGIFMLTMIMSIIITLSSNNIMMTWISMEINMISFMPMMTKSKKSTDQPMKYFIVQSLSSSMMLMSVMMNSILEVTPGSSIILLTSMLMKMGMMPFHLWLPSTMNSLSWENCFILSTIQKIPPTTIMSQMMDLKQMIFPMILSSMMGSITALNQLSMKKIMAYSSISNSTWMIMSMYLSIKMFTIMFSSYFLITFMLMNKMNVNNMLYMNQMKSMNNLKKMSMSITILSMSGMPPLLGFLPKWMILQSMVKLSITLSITMIVSAAISTMVYIKMISPMMMSAMTTKKTKKEKKYKEYDIMINITSIPMMMVLKS
uniref:NADH dehydrogenase subunit 2 n=1 Tax=Eusudasina nantouensis TaxID=766123 RepID=UPI002E77517E|nr:NADH dehydrogenase subunit 2 [Eusudasina nantouensis]WQB38478.1 NADH dehydrogenase subunit 2 [Eusudasina nantouensis]